MKKLQMNPRITALFIFLLGYCNILYPQTSGPSSPEVQNFTPASSNNLVNVFTGDFEYNIPLMDIGGYPINISYTSNVGVEEEASCVGLGWNLNIGVINRQVRGLPDDFMGDEIRKTLNIKPKVTIAAGGGLRLEGFGIDPERFVSIGAGLSANLSFNNYSGFGIQLGSNGKINLAFPMPLTLGMGMNISSMGGNTLSGDLSLGMKQSFLQKTGLKGVGLSLSSNSINGIQNVNFNLQTISEKVNKRSDLFFSRLLDFSNKSYTPNISMPMLSLNSSFSFKGGGELFGAFLSADITVSGSIESLSETEKSTKSYGYLYSEFGDDVDALHDFIRDNDESVGPETPIIAVPIQTYDTYFASGQGFSGSFRPFRKDIGTIYDPRQFSLNVGVNISGEVGAGNAIKAGTNHDVPVYTNESRRWSQDDFIDGPNEAGSIFSFKKVEKEPSYFFKQIGENNILTNSELLNQSGGMKPAKFELQNYNPAAFVNGISEFLPSDFSFHKASKRLNNSFNTFSPVNNLKQEKIGANTFTILTAREKELINDSIQYYKFNNTKNSMSRVSKFRQAHHISEIRITKDDGVKYNYGIAAYNTEKNEYSFNPKTTNTSTDGKIHYSSEDASVDNKNGIDHYFSKTTTPAYAYAYLLTSILSSDYVDISGDGPTEDDFGTYTKFNYYLMNDNFGWRTPNESNKANFNKGLLSHDADQKACFIDGKKEIWFIHSIETRNYIARFYYSERIDGKGSDVGSVLYKLDSIISYTKSEWLKPENERTYIEKTIFQHDYSLAIGATNSTQGKLTLTKLYSLYQNSLKGKNHPYVFSYKKNSNYKSTSLDRWGRYKNYNYLDNERFPYSVQDSSQSKSNSSEWLVSKIVLPSGSELSIEYESDSYSYVQNKSAMEMLQIIGLSNNSTTQDETKPLDLNNKLYSTLNYSDYFIYLKLNVKIDFKDKSEWISEFKKSFEKIYYNAVVNINGQGTQEMIEGFMDPNLNEVYLVKENSSDVYYTYACIKIIPNAVENLPNTYVHPIAKDAWQYMRLHNMQAIFEGNTQAIFNESEIIEQGRIPLENLASNFLSEAGSWCENYFQMFVGGFGNYMYLRGYASSIDLNQSYIRIPVIRKQGKFGGGARVKKIQLNDNWPIAEQNQIFSTEYFYILEDGSSSGVASYEPLIGRQENPFFQPTLFTTSRILGENDHLFITEPFGESLYPGASIGYSRVITRQKGAKTGMMVSEFYTAKDFPIIAERTQLSFKNFKFTYPVWVSLSIDNVTTSQGFYFETNDMNGKPKSESMFDEFSNLIKSTNYYYRDNNEVLLGDSNGIEKGIVGVEWDMVVDARTSKQDTYVPSIEVNMDNFFVPPMPAPIFVILPFPSFQRSYVKYSSIATTKTVQRNGILDKVIVYDKGSTLSTRNLLYDKNTGSVLVAATNNEFKDTVYTTNIPAYWNHKRMGLAMHNEGFGFSNLVGDQVLVNKDGYKLAWNLGNNIYRSSGGEKIENPEIIKVLKSGYTNQLSQSSGTIITLKNPIQENKLKFDKILDANATSYRDMWQLYQYKNHEFRKTKCECSETNVETWIGLINSVLSDMAMRVKIINNSTSYKIKKDKKLTKWNIFIDKYDCYFSFSSYVLPDKISALTPIFDTINCSFTGKFNIMVGNISIEAYSNCTLNYNCGFRSLPSSFQCFIGSDKIINPFSTGIIRSFIEEKKLHYNTNRINNNQIRESGQFENFNSFWDISIVSNPFSKTNWIAPISNEINDPTGKILETKDALGNSQSAIYGYGHHLVTAAAKNARYNEILFESFEDLTYYNHLSKKDECQDTAHWNIKKIIESEPSIFSLDKQISHSGWHSLNVDAEIAKISIPLNHNVITNEALNLWNFKASKQHLITSFNPSAGKYVISIWAHSKENLDSVFAIDIKGTGDKYSMTPKSPVIDGWQQWSCEFEIKSNSTGIILTIDKASTQTLKIDDLRIQPFHANMLCYVYYPNTLKLHSMLDDNNFATYYQYDEEGNLQRINRETEHGVLTVKEIKSGQIINTTN